jgi:hypothetical protein
MKLKEGFEPQDEFTKLNAVTAMDGLMAHIAEALIIPMESQLSDDDKHDLGVIGETLKTIAEKAYFFEQIQNGELHENSVN